MDESAKEAAEHVEWTRIEIAELERELREALAARAGRLGSAPGSAASLAPVADGALECSVVRLGAAVRTQPELDR